MEIFPVGSVVRLQNLVSAAQYNGMRGTVKSDVDATSLRQNVLIDDISKTVAIKPANMTHCNNPNLSAEQWKYYYSHQRNDPDTVGANNDEKKRSINDALKWAPSKKKSKQAMKKKSDGDSGQLKYKVKAYLRVNFEEKDDVKELGAYWDPQRKQWYVRPGKDVRPFEEWSPVPDGQCETCGEAINNNDDEDYVCGFCGRELCNNCLPYSMEKAWRCDSCGEYSCNALGKGNKKCPQFLDDDEPGCDISLCGNFGRQKGCMG